MLLATLSHHARAALRSILTLWTRPAAPVAIMPPKVAEALELRADAIKRRDSRGIHAAHLRARQARIEGLRAEVMARRFKEQMQ